MARAGIVCRCVLFLVLLFFLPSNVASTEETSNSTLTILPSLLNIAPPNQSITLSCDASAIGENISYSWYQSSDGTTENSAAIDDEEKSSLTLQAFTEKGIYYYYCKVKNNDNSEEFLSDIITVAYTGLPTVIVETQDGVNPTTAKEKREGRLRIFYPNGEIYDSNNYSDDGKFTIKVRGNATASYPKKPYKLKLPKKIIN